MLRRRLLLVTPCSILKKKTKRKRKRKREGERGKRERSNEKKEIRAEGQKNSRTKFYDCYKLNLAQIQLAVTKLDIDRTSIFASSPAARSGMTSLEERLLAGEDQSLPSTKTQRTRTSGAWPWGTEEKDGSPSLKWCLFALAGRDTAHPPTPLLVPEAMSKFPKAKPHTPHTSARRYMYVNSNLLQRRRAIGQLYGEILH